MGRRPSLFPSIVPVKKGYTGIRSHCPRSSTRKDWLEVSIRVPVTIQKQDHTKVSWLLFVSFSLTTKIPVMDCIDYSTLDFRNQPCPPPPHPRFLWHLDIVVTVICLVNMNTMKCLWKRAIRREWARKSTCPLAFLQRKQVSSSSYVAREFKAIAPWISLEWAVMGDIITYPSGSHKQVLLSPYLFDNSCVFGTDPGSEGWEVSLMSPTTLASVPGRREQRCTQMATLSGRMWQLPNEDT